MRIDAPLITGSLNYNGNSLQDLSTYATTSSVNNLVQKTGSYALTGSNYFSGSQIISGSITATGNITAQTLIIQTITSSVLFTTGSNIIGSSLSNVQQLTGSVGITGSLAINGTTAIVGSGTANYVPKFTASGTIGNSNLITDANGNLGLGVTPSAWNAIYKVAEIGTTAIWGSTSYNNAAFSTNIFYNAGNSPRYIASDYSNMYIQDDGQHSWYNAPSGTAGNAITFTQAMTLNASGQLGIGTTAPNYTLHIDSNTTLTRFQITNSTTGQGGGVGLQIIQNGLDAIITNRSNGYLSFETVGTERMRITSAGNVGIGTSSPSYLLELTKTNSGTASSVSPIFSITNQGSGNTARIRFSDGVTADGSITFTGGTTTASQLLGFGCSGVQQMVINGNGNVGIGASTSTELRSQLTVLGAGQNTSALTDAGATTGTIEINSNVNGFNRGGALTFGSMLDNGSYLPFAAIKGLLQNGVGNGVGNLAFSTRNSTGATALTERMSIASTGAVTIVGSLSKGSGSFRIDHPLKPDTHQLVHSFIEGPQADLIYRGKLTLVNGKAQANIDEVSTMTEGTFEALCREVQCFTTNENGWDLVKGKVIGNIIYIESQNPNSTDEISWMVIGERKDKHMMDTEWTDEQGKVIVEPLKA